MSRIAQKLCDELEAPVSSLRGKNNHRNHDAKSNRNVVIDKNKTNNKLGSRDNSTSRTKFKPQETVSNKTAESTSKAECKPQQSVLIKTLVDTAVNTLVKGPIVSDNHCVTIVRKRAANINCHCKTPSKCPSNKVNASVKHVQTIDPKLFAFSDKACFHCIKTESCGTQFQIYIPKTIGQDRVECLSHISQRDSRLTTASQKSIARKKDQVECSSHISQKDSRLTNGSQKSMTRKKNQVDCLSHISQRDSRLTSGSQNSVVRQTRMGIMKKDSMQQAEMIQSVLRQPELRRIDMRQHDTRHNTTRGSRIPSVNIMGARRWSLSQYAHRGADF